MKKLLLTIIATTLMAGNLYALDTKCEVNKDYFEICKYDHVYDSRRDANGESYLIGTVLDVFTNENGEKMAEVYWPYPTGENFKETVSIDILSTHRGPICMVNVDEKEICKHDGVFDKRRMMESHLNGRVLELFIDDGVNMAVVSWPVIGGTTTEVTDRKKEEVKIDDLY